jgi:biotin-(acetyl-CoA carboxylase) ligase
MRHGLKMGGMLSQAKWRGYVCTRWIFSVGINVSQAPKAWACMGEAYEVDKVTEALIPLLVKALTQPLPQHEWATYQGHLMGWGQWLQWRDIEKDVLVIAKPVQLDAMGRLQVKTKDGQCQWLQPKQWEWLGEIQP